MSATSSIPPESLIKSAVTTLFIHVEPPLKMKTLLSSSKVTPTVKVSAGQSYFFDLSHAKVDARGHKEELFHHSMWLTNAGGHKKHYISNKL
jgi:hypothetical protein